MLIGGQNNIIISKVRMQFFYIETRISKWQEGYVDMARTVGIGRLDFEKIRTENTFYIDKTDFIRAWWETKDDVTLITRPRRFGKTLNLSMLEKFFSVQYANRHDLFQGLTIWDNEQFQNLQGTYPVINLSFATVKEKNYEMTVSRINQILTNLYSANKFLMESGILDEKEKNFFASVDVNMNETTATMAIHQLSIYLSRYYEKKVIILLDEYDTPMQEAYVNGYWDELVSFTRSMFNAAFKTNSCLERALLSGITRISRESTLSDTVNEALKQIQKMKYETILVEKGVPKENIRRYGFAFCGKRVLIGC